MGEISEGMIDGTLCQTCGVYLGDGLDYPHNCKSCERDSAPKRKTIAALAKKEIYCDVCKKMFQDQYAFNGHLMGRKHAISMRRAGK